MKRVLISTFLIAGLLHLAGGERQELLNAFKKEDAAAEKVFQSAETTVDITGAGLCIEGKTVQLKQGREEFSVPMFRQNTTLELLLYPQNTFSFKGREFAVIRTDIPFAVCDDFSTVYLCELKNGKLQIHTKCGFPYLTKWELQGGTIVFYYEGKTQKVRL